jgi:hypothetical protein
MQDEDGIGGKLDRILKAKAAARGNKSDADDSDDAENEIEQQRWKAAKLYHGLQQDLDRCSQQGFSQELSQHSIASLPPYCDQPSPAVPFPTPQALQPNAYTARMAWGNQSVEI